MEILCGKEAIETVRKRWRAYMCLVCHQLGKACRGAWANGRPYPEDQRQQRSGPLLLPAITSGAIAEEPTTEPPRKGFVQIPVECTVGNYATQPLERPDFQSNRGNGFETACWDQLWTGIIVKLKPAHWNGTGQLSTSSSCVL